MRIAGLRVTNWMRFRGEHTLDLGPTVYAVTARHERDERRSNWLGKSALLGAILFALFGTLPTETKDAAIHHGEDSLSVEMELDDGTFITRRFRRGKPVELLATWRDGEREVTAGDQEALERRLGFDRTTFLASCYFEQKSMSRFVTANPSERSRLVGEWLELEPVQDAHAKVAAKLAELNHALAAARGTREAFEQSVLSPEAVEDAKRELAGVEKLLAAYDAELKVATLREANRAKVDELERIDAALAQMTAIDEETHKCVVASADERLGQAQAAKAIASEKKRTAQGLVTNGFLGKCPVTGKDCPITDEIQKDQRARKKQATAAAEACDLAVLECSKVERSRAELEAVTREIARVKKMRERRDELAADIGSTTMGNGMDVEEIQAQQRVRRDKQFELKRRLENHEQAVKMLAEKVAKQAELQAAHAAYELAARVLGRSGVQRKLAAEFVEYLQDRATARLQDAGIDLSVRLVWGRETQQLAEACEECGTAFPRSAKAIKCAGCGATRGMKRDDKLYVEPSDRSGAADDLAGVAVQLAAAEWIRAARGVDWSTIVLDEPFGALDESNRESLARVLVGLSTDGFEQAFVVAHDRGTLDAMPGRIVVTGGDKASSVEVV